MCALRVLCMRAAHRFSERHRAWIRQLQAVERELVVKGVEGRQTQVVQHDLGLLTTRTEQGRVCVQGVWCDVSVCPFVCERERVMSCPPHRVLCGLHPPHPPPAHQLYQAGSPLLPLCQSHGSDPSTQHEGAHTDTPSKKGFFEAWTYCECNPPARTSLQTSVSATEDAGLNVYLPPSWQTLNSRMAVDWTTTRIRKAPSCSMYFLASEASPAMMSWRLVSAIDSNRVCQGRMRWWLRNVAGRAHMRLP